MKNYKNTKVKQKMEEHKEVLIYFKCIKVGSKLRVRVISPGYNPEANCQFPRSIRQEGLKYSAPISDLSFSKSGCKFFYKVKKGRIKTVENQDLQELKVSLNKIFEDANSDCLICMDNPHAIVIVPCGHYCLCETCAKKLQNTSNKCPLCRGIINLTVTRDQIQM